MEERGPDEGLMALMELYEPDRECAERERIIKAGFGRRDRRRAPRTGGELEGGTGTRRRMAV
jgi:hypothetical protein